MKTVERVVSYIFCGLRIIVDLLCMTAFGIFSVDNLRKNVSAEVNVLIVLATAGVLFLLITDIRMISIRDIRRIASKKEEQKKEKSNRLF